MTAIYNFIWNIVSPLRLTGPIFDKELRVSSRRRRNYVLRFVYVALLTIFLSLVWIEAMGRTSSSIYQVSRMAEAGKGIIVYIVWFQFCATQILAVIMLSNSICDEIYHRTLGLLMTTPISSFQIVIGKLFSKLLQLILLMAISLPLLAIVRVMGGVPWNYVVSSLCITLTAVIFVGSLSLFFSIFSRRTYVVIILTILTVLVLFGLVPWLSGFIYFSFTNHWPGPKSTEAIFFTSPYGIMAFNTAMMMSPRATTGIAVRFWPVHCGIMLLASSAILLLSMCVVRKVALRQATGQTGSSFWKQRPRRAAKQSELNPKTFAGTIRRVVGPPIIWKELRSPMFRHHKIRTFIVVFIVLILLVGSYYCCAIAKENFLDEEGIHATYAVIFLGVGMLFTIVLPATSITTEIESRSWPILLATTLDDKDILMGKFVGALRRCFPAWLLLFGHILAFILLGYIHPFAIIQTVILVIWIVIFLSGSGLYFSSRFKHTTTAVLMNFALAATIWAILPLLMAIVASINAPLTRDADELVEAYIDTNPFVHMGNIMIATAGKQQRNIGNYYWPGQGTLDAVESTFWMLVCMVGYTFIGFLFAWRAKCLFRRKIF